MCLKVISCSIQFVSRSTTFGSSSSLRYRHVTSDRKANVSETEVGFHVKDYEKIESHALVAGGKLKCFVACPSAELLMHRTLLSQEDVLWRGMRVFTLRLPERSPIANSMTGYLSFDLMVDSEAAKANEVGL
ncbi:hypothetical protein GGR58DRAFT_500216 [Xylaria digitata]|nr:hypothetical protein GGR58DRAFT_500216 [Xylaria digitata]